MDSKIPQVDFIIPSWVTDLIDSSFEKGSKAWTYYMTHCIMVTRFALEVAEKKREMNLNRSLLIEGGMLHDIGICKVNAPEIGCYGEHPYIAHTWLGRQIVEEAGHPDAALFCERHIGTGLSREDILKAGFPLPARDMLPETPEEKLICYADKFFSKSERYLTTPRTIEEIRKKVLKYGPDKLEAFNELHRLFS
ncbi:MAG: HD domain-containing protein [Bacteroidales bacterium]